MGDTLYGFRQLVGKAREEETPHVDTADKVLLRIRKEGRIRQLDGPLAIIAAGSLALAAGVTLSVVPLIQSITDPMSGLFQLSASLLR